MSEDLPPKVKGVIPTPPAESDSADSDFDALFAEPDKGDDVPVSREEFNALKKGVAKAFSEQGRKATPKDEDEPKPKAKEKPNDEKGKTTVSPVLKSLYFKSNPEAETVWNTVEAEAEALGKDPFELYESSVFFKGEAKALFEKKVADENAKSNIAMPSTLVKGGKFSFDKVDLDNPDHVKWVNEKPERVDEYNQWLKANWKK